MFGSHLSVLLRIWPLRQVFREELVRIAFRRERCSLITSPQLCSGSCFWDSGASSCTLKTLEALLAVIDEDCPLRPGLDSRDPESWICWLMTQSDPLRLSATFSWLCQPCRVVLGMQSACWELRKQWQFPPIFKLESSWTFGGCPKVLKWGYPQIIHR